MTPWTIRICREVLRVIPRVRVRFKRTRAYAARVRHAGPQYRFHLEIAVSLPRLRLRDLDLGASTSRHLASYVVLLELWHADGVAAQLLALHPPQRGQARGRLGLPAVQRRQLLVEDGVLPMQCAEGAAE